MKRKKIHLTVMPKEILTHLHSRGYKTNDMGMSSALVYDYGDMILKVDYQSEETINEVRMCGWLAPYGLAPRIIAEHLEKNIHFILMEKVQGMELCGDSYLKNPGLLIDCLITALKLLWKIPIEGCPSHMTIENKLKLAKKRVMNKEVDLSDWDDEIINQRFKTPEELYDYLERHKHHEHLVMSHGDFCLPNIFFKGKDFERFIDLGRAGLSSKWQDIALCVRSLKYNLGTDQYIPKFFAKLGIEPNHDLIDYYLLMDELF